MLSDLVAELIEWLTGQLNAYLMRSRYFWYRAMQEPDPTARQALHEEAQPPLWVRVLLWIGELPGGDGDPGER